ncbi:alpha-methylacyl-CoA racemase-like [Watersipora subatra]|uniref:alpha-methylacyl-CoA racemase-like n=1 Tax=Watersipora subatra TaxID=2589382 RepID=UPI00355B8FBB
MALKGIRVVELGGLAPVPFCGMILADHGASVIRVDKIGGLEVDTLSRGKRSIAVNLRKPPGVNVVKRVCSTADVLIEPFRPGIMEKLGLGPSILCKENPRLIYARLTGFGQNGSYRNMAGHDINYIATCGILSRLGRKGSNPTPPINLLGDFAGGGLMCALGIMLALFERTRSGKGQVIDANMVQGSSYISSFLWSSLSLDYGGMLWGKERGDNLLDTGCPFYDTYKTRDDKYMAVGALEPQFFANLLRRLGLSDDDYSQSVTDWAALRDRLTQLFLTKTQEEWSAEFDGSDACVTPVLDLLAAPLHPHNEHSFFKDADGAHQPSPAPGLSRTPAMASADRLPQCGEHTTAVLSEFGFSSIEIKDLLDGGIIKQSASSKL